jgi:uncharacterized protein YyaL (SSP411 family)
VRRDLAQELARRGADYTPRTRNLRADGSPRFTNRLLLEASPYLQQHAHNPVDWHPWGDEAFETARRLGRPVLVSIGYSTCHWCHVMEEESYDDPEVAAYLNQHFVAIKVDREVRPDVDSIYMTALHALSGTGGWPLNVWLTPDREPFFAGTYFPPQDRAGRPGFRKVLETLQAQYEKDPERIAAMAERLSNIVRSNLEAARAEASFVPDPALLARARDLYAIRIDPISGGIGSRTKFPAVVPFRFLLRHHRRTGDPEALDLAVLTLEQMARGGIYDQIGGGFHRYSTDPRWRVPHFEKMLYDNARLAVVYLEAWQATAETGAASQRAELEKRVREILAYVEREMTSPEGGFYSASDADSLNEAGEAEEGWFFTWTLDELTETLGADATSLVAAHYGVTARGNLDGRNVLRVARTPQDLARDSDLDLDEVEARLAAARERMLQERARRPPPLRDDKILAAWNGLMISAFAQAGFVLAEPRWIDAAARAADLVLRRMRRGGRLLRVYQNGQADGPAFLEDYAFLIAALLDLYEARPDPRWLSEAIALQTTLDAHYADAAGGGYFQTSNDHDALLAREKPSRDGAVPSGNSVEALNLLRLYAYTTRDAYLERVGLLFSAFGEILSQEPTALPEMLAALEFQIGRSQEIVLVRPSSGGDLAPMLTRLRARYVPNRVLSIVTEGEDLEAHASLVPLVKHKRAREGRVTAYVCEDRVCDSPTADPEEFARQLSPSRNPR